MHDVEQVADGRGAGALLEARLQAAELVILPVIKLDVAIMQQQGIHQAADSRSPETAAPVSAAAVDDASRPGSWPPKTRRRPATSRNHEPVRDCCRQMLAGFERATSTSTARFRQVAQVDTDELVAVDEQQLIARASRRRAGHLASRSLATLVQAPMQPVRHRSRGASSENQQHLRRRSHRAALVRKITESWVPLWTDPAPPDARVPPPSG
jgi:hypothetical protein